MNRLRNRIAQGNVEGGFTLIELLVVIIILGILLAIAVPSYIGFKSKAEKSAAAANLRAAVPAIEAFYADNGTYVGLGDASTAATPGMSYYDPASTSKVTIQAARRCRRRPTASRRRGCFDLVQAQSRRPHSRGQRNRSDCRRRDL